MRARAQGGRVTQRCHNSPHWKQGYGVRVTSRTGRARRILGDFEKVRVEMRPASAEDSWLSLARGDLVAGATRVGGGGR